MLLHGAGRGYFFNPAFQFTTTVSGGDDAAATLSVTTKKRFPLAVTSLHVTFLLNFFDELRRKAPRSGK